MRPIRSGIFVVLTDHAGGAEQVSSMVATALSRREGWHVKYRVLSARSDPSFSASRLSPEIDLRFSACRSPLPARLLTLPLQESRQVPDLVFTTHVYTNALAAFARRIGGLRARRLVARESTTAFDRFTGLKRLLYRALYRLYGGQDLIIAQTGYMAEHIRPHLPARARTVVRVLPNPVDVDAIDRAAAEPLPPSVAARLDDRPAILVCGRLIEVKQPGVALAAYEGLRRMMAAPPRLVFMGDGPLRPALEAEVAARGLGNEVIFLGQQANPYAVMRRCQYGLLTSSREGFPNVVLEMMACSMRKIVMTPCAGDLDTLTGVTVTPDFSAESLAGALATAIDSGEDSSATYRAVVEERSVERYLDAVLGELAT